MTTNDEALRQAINSLDLEGAQLRAAKERLGAWLVAQTWRSYSMHALPDGSWRCRLHWLLDMQENFQEEVEADGPTEAAAILAALEKVNA